MLGCCAAQFSISFESSKRLLSERSARRWDLAKAARRRAEHYSGGQSGFVEHIFRDRTRSEVSVSELTEYQPGRSQSHVDGARPMSTTDTLRTRLDALQTQFCRVQAENRKLREENPE